MPARFSAALIADGARIKTLSDIPKKQRHKNNSRQTARIVMVMASTFQMLSRYGHQRRFVISIETGFERGEAAVDYDADNTSREKVVEAVTKLGCKTAVKS